MYLEFIDFLNFKEILVIIVIEFIYCIYLRLLIVYEKSFVENLFFMVFRMCIGFMVICKGEIW